jgi:hypothetical protein
MARDVIAELTHLWPVSGQYCANTVHDLHSRDFDTLADCDKRCGYKSPNIFQDLTSYQKVLSLELAETREAAALFEWWVELY